MAKLKFEIDRAGNGKVWINGVEIGDAVQALKIVTTAGEPSTIDLRLGCPMEGEFELADRKPPGGE